MSKVKNVKKVVVLGGAMLASLLCAGILLQGNSVQANAATTASYAQLQGASVRYNAANENQNQAGLRFTYTVDKAAAANDFGTDFANVQAMGMLVVPNALLGTGETIFTSDKTVDTKFINGGESVAENEINVGDWNETTKVFTVNANGDDYGMFVYIYNLPQSVYNQNFTCVGYYQLDGGEVKYTDPMERSIAEVARKAYDNADYGEDAQKQASLESFLLDYTATYNAGEGTASKESESLEYGKALTATATLSGYEFDGWTNAAGEKVTQITGDVTLNANYKKDGGTVIASLQDGIAIDYAGDSVVSATLDDTDVTANTTVSGGKIKVDGSVLANEKTYTLVVKETAYKTATYAITTMDTSITREFAPINTSNAKAVSYGTATGDLEIVSNPYGKTGNYFKVTSTSDEPGIKVLPSVSEDMLKAYEGGEVRFEYYIESASSNTVHILSTRRDSSPESPDSATTEYYQVETATTGKWVSVSIPVSVFTQVVTDIASKDGQTKTEVTTSVYNRIVEGFSNNQHNGKLFAMGWAEGGATFYVGNMQLVSKETVQATPLSWQGKVTSGVTKAYNYGDKGALTITEATAMDSSIMETALLSSGWYYTYANTEAGLPGVKIATSLTKAELQARADQNLYFEFYVDLPGTNKNVKYMYNTSGTSTTSVSNAFNAWHLVSVPVSYLIENYDAYTSLDGNRKGLTIEVSGECTGANIYVSEMKIMSKEVLKNNLSKTINFTEIVSGNAKAGKYGGHDANQYLTVETVTDAGDYNGDYYRINLPATWNSVGLFINPTISKEILSLYSGGTFTVKYKVNVGTTTTQDLMFFMSGYHTAAYTKAGVATGTWGTVTIPVDTLIAQYDNIVSGYNGTVAQYIGELIAVKESGNAVDFYIGGFTVTAPNA